MSRLLSDSESDSNHSENYPSTSQSSINTLSNMFPVLNQFTPMNMMIMCQNTMGNMTPIPQFESMNDPNKCFYLVMPITAKELKNHFAMFNQNDFIKQHRSTFLFQNQSNDYIPSLSGKKMLETRKKSKSKLFNETYNISTEQLKNSNGLIILDKVPILKLNKIDSTYMRSVNESSLENDKRIPTVKLERIKSVNVKTESDISEQNSWVGKCCCCKKSYSDFKTLQKHVQLKHQKSRMFFCKICGQSFLLRKLLNKHIKFNHRSLISIQIPPDKNETPNHSFSSNLHTNINTSKNIKPTNLFSVSVKKPEEAIAKKSSKTELSKFRRKSERILNRSIKGDKNDSSSPESKLIVSVTKVVKKPGKMIKSDPKEIETVVNNYKESSILDNFKEILLNENKSRSTDLVKKDQYQVKSEKNQMNLIDNNSKISSDKYKSDQQKLKISTIDIKSSKSGDSINESKIENKKESRNSKNTANNTKLPLSICSRRYKLGKQSREINILKNKNLISDKEQSSITRIKHVYKGFRKRNTKTFNTFESIKNKKTDLCWYCRLIQNTIQVILDNTSVADLNNFKVKCPMCPKFFISTHHLQLHLSSLHWLCSRRPKCTITSKQNVSFINKHSLIVSCSQCNKKFVSKEQLKIHIKVSHGSQKEINQYKCSLCDAQFSGNDNYYNHFLSFHSKERKAPLEISQQTFIQLIKNSEKTQKDEIICSICKIKYSGKYDLALHHQTTHLDYPNMCSNCGKVYKTKNEVLKHILTHEENTTYIVFYKYQDKQEVEHHENGKTKVKTNGKIDENMDSTKSLTQTFENYSQKKDCDLQVADTVMFKRKYTLSSATDATCSKTLKLINSDDMSCKICNKSFATAKLYIEHAYFIHDAEFEDSIVNEILIPKNDFLLSKDENTDTTTVASIIEELLDTVTMNEQKITEVSMKIKPENVVEIGSMVEELCDLENKQTKINNENLNKEIHQTNKMTFHCSPCYINFVSKELLNLHKFFVHQDQSLVHICENCSKVIGTIESVNEHKCLETMTFYCEYCDLRFNDAVILNKHNMEKHSEAEGFHLCYCGREFLTNRMLMKHIRVLHSDELEDKNEVSMEVDSNSMSVHIIPIDNQIMTTNDQIAELGNIFNVQYYIQMYGQTSMNCSNLKNNIATQNYCSLCQITLPNQLGINDHYLQKHWFQGGVCKLCGSMFQLTQEIRHIIEDHIHPHEVSKSDSKYFNIYESTCKFIQVLKPACLVTILLYRLQNNIFKFEHKCKCIICEEQFCTLEKLQKHYLQIHDKICVLCNQTFISSSLAASHKIRKHKSLEAYLWFINRAANYLANIVTADDFLSFERCFCKILIMSHKIAAKHEKRHSNSCKQYISVSYICQLMTQCIEDFGQSKTDNKSVLLVMDEDIVKYKHDISKLAIKMISNINQLTLEELTKLLKNYVRSLE